MRTVTAVFSVPDAVALALLDATRATYERRDKLKDAIARGEVELVECEAERVEVEA